MGKGVSPSHCLLGYSSLMKVENLLIVKLIYNKLLLRSFDDLCKQNILHTAQWLVGCHHWLGILSDVWELDMHFYGTLP